MEFSNRRLLLVNEDVPITTSIPPLPHIHGTTTNNNSSSPPESMTSSSSMFGRPLPLPLRPFFTSNLAFAFLILFVALFFIGFIFLYIRQFSDTDSSSSSSSSSRRRRRHLSHQGVDPTSAKSLPVFSYNGDAKQMDCAICLDEFRVGDSVKMITYCKHVFHKECIDTWLAAHVTCPVCRCTKFADEDGERSTAENGEDVREVGSESQS
ncbi:RING-H2 finger protein ATL57 [Gastrolobium bilobum]|uniref:RING-H2 finger protein ATL57 n=1 Tax=Gastrolobium bilobum TaxID=150636 RepID=UPI002AAF4412|nr:RING-H2 finger protein ATL57 [Gastrolobium bilobum]